MDSCLRPVVPSATASLVSIVAIPTWALLVPSLFWTISLHSTYPQHPRIDIMQNSNSAAHDKACQAIERAKGLVQEQEERFDAYFQSPGDIPQMYDLMEFYPIKDEYMFYKRELLDAMEEVSTKESLEAQLETALEMLCLDRIDQNRVRFRVPLLMLQLGKDAECYAVIKWCSQPHIFDEYEWGHTILPLSSLKRSSFRGN